MDENLVIHALQWKDKTDFDERYTFFENEVLRDLSFSSLLINWEDPEVVFEKVAKVTLTVRVETVT